MRVLIDARMIYHTGIGRYIRSIIREASDLSSVVTYTLAGDPKQIELFCKNLRAEGHEAPVDLIPYTASLYGLGEQVQGGRLLRCCPDVDVFHCPHFNGPWSLPESSVVTVHDLIPFLNLNKQGFFKLAAGKQVLRNVLQKAARIIVVSDHTADDLRRMFPDIPLENKMRRIYQGISSAFGRPPEEEVDTFKSQQGLDRYILYVGTRTPHKNLARLLGAYQQLKPDFPDLQLVVAGNRKETPDEVDLMKKKLKLTGLVEWEGASDRELLNLYAGAKAVVFPSLYEGFGLPPLEAMACGTPVVVSNTTSIPEVVGNAGIYADPYDVESIANGVRLVLSNNALQQELRQKGLERAARFTWKRTFQQTAAVYQEVLQEKRSKTR